MSALFGRAIGCFWKAPFFLPANLASPALRVKPSAAAAVPEAGVMRSVNVGKGACPFSHGSLQGQAGVMFTKSGDIYTGNLLLDFERVDGFTFLVKLQGFLIGMDSWSVFHGALP